MVTRVPPELREKLAPFYSDIGRPSIDPELMIRMLIVGYCYGIRSERRLSRRPRCTSHIGGSAGSILTTGGVTTRPSRSIATAVPPQQHLPAIVRGCGEGLHGRWPSPR